MAIFNSYVSLLEGKTMLKPCETGEALMINQQETIDLPHHARRGQRSALRRRPTAAIDAGSQ